MPKELIVRMAELSPKQRVKVRRQKLALEERRWSTIERIAEREIPQRMLGDLGMKTVQ